MRHLREKHGISLLELSRYCDVTQQRLSEIELGNGNATAHMSKLVETAFARYIEAKRGDLDALEDDINIYRNRLIENIEEGDNL
jgi:transcriptional regulator with XRE-family HTH domain